MINLFTPDEIADAFVSVFNATVRLFPEEDTNLAPALAPEGSVSRLRRAADSHDQAAFDFALSAAMTVANRRTLAITLAVEESHSPLLTGQYRLIQALRGDFAAPAPQRSLDVPGSRFWQKHMAAG